MLRKRSRPFQKDHSRGQLMADLASDSSVSSDSLAQKASNCPFFSVPGLLVGFTTKGLSESDSARSPTSPLDYKLYTNLGNSFVRSPRSPGLDGQPPKSWDCNRVGLGLVDFLNDETKPCGKILGSSDPKNILFGSQLKLSIPTPRTATYLDSSKDDVHVEASPMSLPKNYSFFSEANMGSPKTAIGSIGSELEPGKCVKIRSLSSRLMCLDPKSNFEIFSSNSQLGSLPSVQGGMRLDNNLSGSLPISIGSLSASEIELSEDYTCIISHGPNPKTTHIFGDCILDSHTMQSLDYKNKNGVQPLPSDDFLSYCFSCKKKLEQGKDIYMYRGEKAFCSCNCRDQEILFEEEMEKPSTDSSADCLSSSYHEEIFLDGMAVAT